MTIYSYIEEENVVTVDILNLKILFQFVKKDGSQLDISSAATLKCRIRKPDKTTVLERILTLESGGTNGEAHYMTQAGDVDQAGLYEAWGLVGFTGGLEGWSLPVRFRAVEVPAATDIPN